MAKQTWTQRLNPTRFYAGGVGSEHSTAIYAELYNGSDSAGGGGVRNAGVANAGYEDCRGPDGLQLQVQVDLAEAREGRGERGGAFVDA